MEQDGPTEALQKLSDQLPPKSNTTSHDLRMKPVEDVSYGGQQNVAGDELGLRPSKDPDDDDASETDFLDAISIPPPATLPSEGNTGPLPEATYGPAKGQMVYTPGLQIAKNKPKPSINIWPFSSSSNQGPKKEEKRTVEQTTKRAKKESEEGIAGLERRLKTMERTMRQLEEENSDLQSQNRDLEDQNAREIEKVVDLKTQLGLANAEARENRAQLGSLRKAHAKLQHTVRNLEQELKEEKAMVEELQQNIRDQESIVTKAHSAAVAMLARDVSTDLPDDVVRQRLQKIYDDIFDWCKDNVTPELQDPARVCQQLEKQGIIRIAGLAQYLQFDVESLTGPAVALQAALTHTMCERFLTNPFFLLPAEVFAMLQQHPPSKTLAWRTQTCEFLLQASPSSKKLYTDLATEFASMYRELLHLPMEESSFNELRGLFEEFGTLAMRLWQRKVMIRVEGMDSAALDCFKIRSADMEPHSAMRMLSNDKSLDGRQVCMAVRPRILAMPIGEGSQQTKAVVWSKALVWVSKEEEPMSSYMEISYGVF